MRTYLHIGFALLLSAVISIEAIGFYITKDTCEPCGNSSIMVELLKPIEIEAHTQDDHCCVPEHDHSDCHHNTACDHNSASHNHHQENYYLSHSPDFFERTVTPDIQAQVLTVLLPFIAQCYYNTIVPECYTDTSIPLPDAQDSYRAMLCTYLI